MTYYWISALFNATTSLLLGIFVFLKSKNDSTKKKFSLFAFSISLWSLSYFYWQISTTKEDALFWIRMLTAFSILIPLFYYLFTIDFLKLKQKYTSLVIIFVLIIFFLSPTSLLVSDVSSVLNFMFWGVRGVFYDLYLLTFLLLFLYSLLLLLKDYLKSDGLKRAQERLLLGGVFLGVLGGSTNFFLWYHIPIPPLLNILVAVFVVLTTYAIIRYRLLDIKTIIKRSAVFASLVVIITSLYSLIAYLISVFLQNLIGTQSIIMNGVVTAVIVAVGFEPLKRWLSRVTDKYFFKAEYNPQELLTSLSEKINATLDLQKLLDAISHTLNDAFRSENFSIYLYDKDQKIYEEKSFAGRRTVESISLSHRQIVRFRSALTRYSMEHTALVTEEMKKMFESSDDETMKEIIGMLEKFEVTVAVPIYLDKELSGMFFLGPKKSGDVYTSQDIQLLEIIALQAATAIENAQLYEEQKEFNVTLRQEVKKATAELREANKQLKELDKAKSEFINIASHQLRTPLTAIRGYANMVNTGDFGVLPEKARVPLQRIEVSSVRIIDLVNDLLNISRIESGRMEYEFTETDFQELVQTVCNEVGVLAHRKKLEFTCILPTEKIPPILMDGKKLREVVMNLTDNAIKYTDKGFVRAKLERVDNEVVYSVSDSGRGIAPDDMDKLFKKFSRVEGSSMHQAGGTGLGLFIAKKMVEKHYGRIWAESEGEGKGATFYLALPIVNKKLEKDLKNAGGNVLEKRH